MSKTLKFAFLTIYLLLARNSYSNQYRPDSHAPIGVMRDHVHKKGQIMTSYRYSYMKMKGLRNEDSNVRTAESLSQYTVTPTKMTMKMHMIGAMYGVTNNLTISAMGSFIEKNMDHVSRTNGTFNRETDDIGDTKLNTSYQFLDKNSNKILFNLGLSLPTGNIDKKNNGSKLPYPMQIGSGSYELLPGISYQRHYDNLSYGGQLNSTFRLNTNDNGYKLGDNYNLTAWISRKVNNALSISTRLNYDKNEAIEGLDKNIKPNQTMIATADNALQDRQKLDLLIGFNLIVPKGSLEGNRIALEFGKPIYQRIDGPMLKNNYKVTIGWQNTF